MADDRDFNFLCGRAFRGGGFCSFGREYFCWLFGLCGRRQNADYRIQQIVDTACVFGGNREHLLHAEPMEIIQQRRLFRGIDFIDSQEKGPVGLAQQPYKFEVGSRKFGTTVDDHNDGGCLVKSHTRLTKNLRRNEVFFLRQYSASVNDAQLPPAPLCVAVETIASNAGLVTDNGAARAHNAVEKRGFADIGASDDSNDRQRRFGRKRADRRIVR